MNGRYTLYRTLIVAATIGVLLLLWRLLETIVVLVIAIIFASAIRPIVKRIANWGVPFPLAIVSVYLAFFSSVGVLLAYALPPLYGVIDNLINDNFIIQRLTGLLLHWSVRLGYSEFVSEILALPELWESWKVGVAANLQTMAQEEGLNIAREVVGGFGQLVLALVMSFYWLTARDQIQTFILSMTPIRHRGRLETIFNDVEKTLGDYVRGTGILMASIGTSAFVGLLLLGVPSALPLAVLAGLFEAIPMIGATLGALPAVLVAFTVSPATGLLTILLFVVIQFLENNVLVPRVMAASVGLNPLLVLLAIVAGGTLKGVLGALLAIPVVGAIQVIARYLVVEPMQEEAQQRHDEHGIPVFDGLEKAGAPEDAKPSDIVIAQG